MLAASSPRQAGATTSRADATSSHRIAPVSMVTPGREVPSVELDPRAGRRVRPSEPSPLTSSAGRRPRSTGACTAGPVDFVPLRAHRARVAVVAHHHRPNVIDAVQAPIDPKRQVAGRDRQAGGVGVGEPLRQRLLRRELDLPDGIQEPPLNVVHALDPSAVDVTHGPRRSGSREDQVTPARPRLHSHWVTSRRNGRMASANSDGWS